MSAIAAEDKPISSMAERLREIAKAQPNIDVTQFQFIGLDEVQQVYGDKWPVQKARIKSIAHQFLSKRLDPADVIIPGGDGFVVVFGSAKGSEAEAQAATLTHGLNEFFLGSSGGAAAPRMKSTSRSVAVESLMQALREAEIIPPEPEPARDERQSGETTRWTFQPVWDVSREALTSYYAVPTSKATGLRVPGYQFEASMETPPLYADIDLATLKASETEMRKLFASGKKALIGVSVHVQSLVNSMSRQKICAAIDEFDPELARYRMLKIAAVPQGFPRMYLENIVNALRRRIPNLAVGLSWDEPAVNSLLSCGFGSVGFALPEHVVGSYSSVDQAVLLQKIKRAREAAHGAKAKFFIEGAIRRDLALRLSAMGVDNISSSLIWEPLAAPDGVVRWTADRLAGR